MPKKATKKRTRKKTSSAKTRAESHEESHDSKINKAVLENFVSLQKVMTNFVVKMDSMTTQISKLLELFEISAKALAEKDFEIEKDNQEMLSKLDILIDQNKILAKGLTLMHERMPREAPPVSSMPPQQQTRQPSMPAPWEMSSSPKGPAPGMQRPMTKEMPENKSNTTQSKPVFESPI